MRRARDVIGAVIVLIGIGSLVPAGAQAQNILGLQHFGDAIGSYMALRHDVEHRVGVPYASTSVPDIDPMQAALARGIRQARANANVGDIFTPAVAREFRRRIDRAIDSRAESGDTFMIDARRATAASSCRPALNGPFDWRFGAMMPVDVTAVLPDLPWPLQYRFVCRDLVLLDIDAGLIVDILRGALTAE
jgi:hypothetical protein